jgi:hypothetical protein
MTVDQPAPATPIIVSTPAPAGTDRLSVVLAIAFPVVLIVAGVVNLVFGTMFPSGAAIEPIWNFGITVDLIAVSIAFVVRFLVLLRRPRFPAVAVRGPGPLALAAFIVSGAVAVGWLVFGGGFFLAHLISAPDELRYYLDVNGAFFLGGPWMVGLFLGVASLRQGKGLVNTVFAVAAIVLPLLILVASLFSAVAYGLGLTD